MTEQPKIKSRLGGPLMVNGEIPLVRQTPTQSEPGAPQAWTLSDPITDRAKYALCRCGASEDKPFCDGAHNNAEFEGTDTFGQPDNCTFDPDNAPECPAQIGAIDNGPFMVTGQVEISNSNGDILETRNQVTLCRCGKSSNLPLCDGSHRAASFIDSAPE